MKTPALSILVLAGALVTLAHHATAQTLTTMNEGIVHDLNGRLIFGGVDSEPWSSDGPGGKIGRLRDIQPGKGWSLGSWDSQFPSNPGGGLGNVARVGDEMFFFAFDKPGQLGLWKTNGTTAGTIKVQDHGSIGYGMPFGGAPIGNTLLYAAGKSTAGLKLWRTNATRTAASPIGASVAVTPWSFHAFGSRVLFSSHNSSFAVRDVWISDGSAAGTRSLGRINPGIHGATAAYVNFRGAVYLTGHYETGRGHTLYRIDSTGKLNTVMQFTAPRTPLLVGTGFLAATPSHLYMLRVNGTGGTDLLRSDGTAAGTKIVAPNVSTTEHAGYLTVAGNKIFFLAHYPQFLKNKTELWMFDETAATLTLAHTSTALFGWSMSHLKAFGSRRVAFANLGAPWVSDGTVAGTRLLVTGPRLMTFESSGGLLHMLVPSGVRRVDLLTLDLGATTQTLGPGCTRQGLAPVLTSSDPILGRPVQLRVSAAVPSKPGLLFVGLQPRGRILAVAGCALYLDPAASVSVPLRTDASGDWRGQFLVPNVPGLIGLRAVGQAGLGPTANPPLHADITSAVLLRIGR